MYSLGLQIPFGAKKVKFVDSDGDGVADGSDRCPATPVGTPVDEYGCELDSDNDGVANSKDRCPNTRAGAKVDANGCEPDTDGDGVADSGDNCPNTVRGAKVDINGCEIDGDGDGVVDRLDKCPNTPKGVQVDVAGCEIKAEIRLPGVNFESNSDRLLGGTEQVLANAAATLVKNPSIEVEVAGHTDSDGAAAYNESLSERRARTVRDYLASHGVAMNRMTVRGYGEAEPIADNGTREGKAQNRRVVLRITSR
jgi:OOP family OmpA-OmpF porin